MKRIVSILLFISLIFALISLTSCHGSNATPAFEVPEGLEDGKTYEIVFWAKNDSNPTQVAIYEGLIRDFEEIYPNIKVTLKRYTNYGDIYNDVLTNIQTGTTPNVCITYPDHIATYMTGENVVVPLDGLMSDKKYGLGGSEIRFDAPTEDEMIEQFMAEGQIGQVQYALPFMRSTEACYINKTYVEAMGYEVPDVLTWDFIFEVSRVAAAKKPDGTYVGNGKKKLIPLIYMSTDNMMIQVLEQKGAGYSTEEGDILIFNEDTADILYELADLTKAGAFSTFGVSSYPGNWFNAGECLFAIDSTAGATWMGPHAPLIDSPKEQLTDFEVAVRPVPQYDTENPKMISQGPSLCIFNKEDPREVLASWIFAQYLLTNEVQIPFSTTEGYIPVTEKAQSAPEYRDYLSRSGEDNDTYYEVKIEAAKLLLENTDNTFVTPVFNGSANLRNAAGEMIEDVVKSTKRKKTVDDEYIAKLYEDMNSRYKLSETSQSGDKINFKPMPAGSIVLLSVLGGIWLLLGAWCIYRIIKKYKTQ